MALNTVWVGKLRNFPRPNPISQFSANILLYLLNKLINILETVQDSANTTERFRNLYALFRNVSFSYDLW